MFLKNNQDNLVLGSTDRLGLLKLSLSPKERATHTYVIGITGMGKSKLLEHCLFQDVTCGRGCGLLDPHSDLANDLLSYLVTQGYTDLERILYFDLSRQDYLIPFNVLNQPLDPYQLTENVIEAFRRTWPGCLKEAPRFSQIARASLLTLIENGLSLVEMQPFLVDKDYRERLLPNVSDPGVVSFFRDEYDQWGRDQPLLISPVLNKTSAFTFHPQMRLVLGQKENHLDLRKIMDQGKVLIIDLGGLAGETQRLLGSLVTVFLEQAALSRKNLRRPFYFYIDEFAGFCANEGSVKTLAQILSQCRKFGLHLTLAHQTLSQLDQRMVGALANIQTKVVFGLDRDDAEILAKKLGEVDTSQVKHEAQSKTQHPLFSPLPEQWEEWVKTIQRLPPRQALVATHNRKVAKIRTITVKDRGVGGEELERIKKFLAKKSGRPYHELREKMADGGRRVRGGGEKEEAAFWEKAVASL